MPQSFIMRIQRGAFLRAMISRQSVPGSVQGFRFFRTAWITRTSLWAVATTACLQLFLALRARKWLWTDLRQRPLDVGVCRTCVLAAIKPPSPQAVLRSPGSKAFRIRQNLNRRIDFVDS